MIDDEIRKQPFIISLITLSPRRDISRFLPPKITLEKDRREIGARDDGARGNKGLLRNCILYSLTASIIVRGLAPDRVATNGNATRLETDDDDDRKGDRF
ncbi:hypothetical protein EVAR_65247_1 [Eumeta japonica]|uniref:Uncharacterized protein n=1 Tax=Eumeta variegata TaxID=151549 RepID=A0A4C1ZPZ6_EUMVA|nr:hypothetical protein EVAR_65247_1 [Eumeta japonica]